MVSNPNRIVSPLRTSVVGHDQHGWTARENEIKEMFGLAPKAKWPNEGMSPRVIQGVYAWVNSKADAKRLGFFQRANCQCPQCLKTPISLGRLAQHVCKERDLKEAERIRAQDEQHGLHSLEVSSKGFVELPASYLTPLYDIDTDAQRETFAKHMQFVFSSFSDRDYYLGAKVTGTPYELFKLFLEFRMGGVTQEWDSDTAARLSTNSCEGNADVVFYRDDYRFTLSTEQENESGLTLYIAHDPLALYASEQDI